MRYNLYLANWPPEAMRKQKFILGGQYNKDGQDVNRKIRQTTSRNAT
jgi:hypothetical protein